MVLKNCVIILKEDMGKMIPKKIFKLSVIFISLFILLGLFFPVCAKNNDTRKIVILEKEEVITEDYFASGDSITISGLIEGDAYLAGGTIVVEGVVNGDLLAVGGTFTLNGDVKNDLRVGAGEITIDGLVGRNVTVAGGSSKVTRNAQIKGSILALTGNLELNGPVEKGARVFAGRAYINNLIGDSLKGSMGELTLGSRTEIRGNLDYKSPEEATKVEKATVSGEIRYTPGEVKEAAWFNIDKWQKFRKSISRFRIPKRTGIKIRLLGFLFTFGMGILLLFAWPKKVEKTVGILAKKPWTSLGYGVLTVSLLPVVFVLLLITIVGIPLALSLLFVFGFTFYFAKFFAAVCTGGKIIEGIGSKPNSIKALFFGLFVYFVLQFLPVIGFFGRFIFSLFGLGAFVLSLKTVKKEKKSKK